MSRTPGEVIEEVRRMIAGDGPEFSSLFAPDGVLRYPFAPPGTPTELSGREAIRDFYQAGESSKGVVDIAGVETVVHRTDDPETVVAEFTSHGMSHATGEPYRFRAIAVAKVRDGQILLYEDYIDPIALARMVGRTQQLADTLINELTQAGPRNQQS